ncbi:MAG: AAA family ATPase [Oscillospiraceae bacterium]|nr:AAA family ATPase [Oscillospiraceae bacterium]
MAVSRVEIEDFRVFKGEFAVDFCKGVNVIIGGNGTGKTTLLKAMYSDYARQYGNIVALHRYQNRVNIIIDGEKITSNIFIPEKDILEHAKGLLTFIAQKPTGFSGIYKDVLISALDVPMQEQSEMQKSIGQKVVNIIGGTVEWVQSEGTYYTIKTDGNRIPFSDEASGFKKFGYLGLLVASGQLEPGAILFWDEPENSLNPELIPELVDILLKLSRIGVQIFVATHNYTFAKHIDIKRENTDNVLFLSLYKDEAGIIKNTTANSYSELENNPIEEASENLFNAVIEKAMGG